MSSYHHTPWQDNTTQYKQDHMNVPLGELDSVLHDVSGEAYTLSGELATGVHDFHDQTITHSDTLNSADEIVVYDSSSGEYRKTTVAELGGAEEGGVGIYDMGVTIPGQPGSSSVVCTYPMPRAVRFPASGGSSLAEAGTGATGSPVFALKKDGVQFQTVTFSGTTGTYSGDQSDFAVGEVFTIVAPASQDATLADIGFAITAVRL